jgi:hypothetical protein
VGHVCSGLVSAFYINPKLKEGKTNVKHCDSFGRSYLLVSFMYLPLITFLDLGNNLAPEALGHVFVFSATYGSGLESPL